MECLTSRKISPCLALVLLIQPLCLFASDVEILAYAKELTQPVAVMVPDSSEVLTFYLPAGATYTRFSNLGSLKKLKTLNFPGSGYALDNDEFLKDLPQLEVLIFKNINGPLHWPNLKTLSKLKVFIHRFAYLIPYGLEFYPGLNLEFVALQNMEHLPTLRGYSRIGTLDLSYGIFQTPGPGTLDSLFPKVEILHFDGFISPPGSWASSRVRFRGIEDIYKEKYPLASN